MEYQPPKSRNIQARPRSSIGTRKPRLPTRPQTAHDMRRKQQKPNVFLSFCNPDCNFSCTVAKKHKLCCDSTAKCRFWLLKLNKTVWFCSPNHLTLPMTRYGCRVPQRLSRALGNYRRRQITDWSCTEAFSLTSPLRKGRSTDWSCSEAFSFTNPLRKC